MAQDTAYSPIPYLYKSRGAVAREGLDRAPDYTYIQLLNCQEREEELMSSRYGTEIINRDPEGVGTANYFFTSPVTSITRLSFQSNAWRYAGLADGTLWRRAGDTQGAYTQIDSGLSGQPFGSLVTNCYETSLPFLFIYDKNLSIKDNGTLSPPQLTGIDAPANTANAVPYSPLLTLIDNFAQGNSYSTTVITGWAWSAIETLTAVSGQVVTDFSEFLGVQQAGGGTYVPSTPSVSAAATATSGVSTDTSPPVTGFPSVVVLPSQTVTCTVNISADVSAGTGNGGGSGEAQFQYSTDGGSSWIAFYTWTKGVTQDQSYTLDPTNVNVSLTGVSNINTIQFRVFVRALTSGGPPPEVDVDGAINSVTATVTSVGIFGIIAPGMLSILNTNSSISISIVSVVSSGFTSGFYQTLTVTTQDPHGLANGDYISLYGCSNALVDGFYQVVNVIDTNNFTVYYDIAQGIRRGSPVYLDATGGYVYGGAPAPATCVLTNEYSTPYPAQMSAWGFYQQVPTNTASFPISAWQGSLAAGSTGTIGKSIILDLSIGNQVTDDDLIVITLMVSNPENISNIRLQFDVAGSTYTSAYYYKDITPAYYQGNVANQVAAYTATQSQILADTLGLFSGQPPNSTSAQLQPGNISTGSGAWATVYLRRGDFLPVGNAGLPSLDWSAITGWQLVITTLSTGSSTISVNGLYLQWGYGPSSFAGTGYDYRYTYYDADTGTEGNPSPIQEFDEQFGYLASLKAPFFLRQAAQVTGFYTTDPQVTHVRVYRRGGTVSSNWYQVGEILNNPGDDSVPTLFVFKDVIPDAALAQAQSLVLDNDPPVTSSLVTPINTTLATGTSGPSNTIYSIFSPQIISAVDTSITFVPGQIVLVGNPNNLEEVEVLFGSASYGGGKFSATLRLQHNAGEPVIAYSIPRVKCDICSLVNLPGGNTQVLLAGDENNPHYVYYSKPGRPENFGPQNYVKTSSPDDAVMAIIDWRGTTLVGTLKTWYIYVGGAQPYLQPTGSQHGIVAKHGWVVVEGAVWYRAADGLREFTGADGVYKTLPVEWVYRDNSLSLIPLADLSQQSQDIMCYYANQVYTSYISQNDGLRYRMIFDRIYQRFRYDDVQATAMFWEKDTNTFLTGKPVSPGNYAVVEDQVYTQDYDDGGWSGSSLVETPINMLIESPYLDLGKPHYPKHWNMLETDVNTNGMTMQTTLYFDDGDTITPIVLATQNTGTTRKKVQFTVTGTPDSSDTGSGQQAYRASILHSFQVTVAPILYQENIYAAVLADLNTTFDSYWIKFNLDESKFIKEGYFDYTSPVPINVSLYADNNQTAYWTFTLPGITDRAVQRVRFSNLNPGTTAFTCRTWRLIALSTDNTQPFQMWAKPRIRWKPIVAGATYQITELEV